MVTFVTWLISRIEFLVRNSFYNDVFVDVRFKRFRTRKPCSRNQIIHESTTVLSETTASDRVSRSHYTTLPHTATSCNTLQHTVEHCDKLPHTATRCNTLHRNLMSTAPPISAEPEMTCFKPHLQIHRAGRNTALFCRGASHAGNVTAKLVNSRKGLSESVSSELSRC